MTSVTTEGTMTEEKKQGRTTAGLSFRGQVWLTCALLCVGFWYGLISLVLWWLE